MHGRDLWPVKADIAQFEQVIVNLAVNARDAMPDGGKLTLRTANVERRGERAAISYKGMPVGEYVLVEVADTGTGIPPEIIDKIFDPFFTTKEVGKGTGLGLSTVYGIVKQTGGFIYRGFRARQGHGLPHLPAALHSGGRRPAGAATAGDDGAGARRRDRRRPMQVRRTAATDLTGHGTILLVEDEEGLRALNARGLNSRGYTVIEAGNGVEAIEALARQGGKVDLVVSDVVMPEMDGPDAAQGAAQAQTRHQDHLRVGLCRGRVREEPARSQAVQFSWPSRSRSSSWSAR